jgi:3-deoxy-D-arabino-heptulosonate 7-phosphate (DAHP) synthase
LIIEVHDNPEEALSDKDQALTPESFAELADKIFRLRDFMEELN